MKKYEVVNPYIIFSVRDKAGRREYALKKGDVVELPEMDVAVLALLSRKQIKEVADQTPAHTAKKR